MGQIIRTTLREILRVRDVVLELRYSVAHVYNVINGKVKNVSRLPAIAVGRRKLIQRDTCEEWKKNNEQSDYEVLPSSTVGSSAATSVGSNTTARRLIEMPPSASKA